MKKMNTKEIIASMNTMASEWSSQFDDPPDLELNFDIAPVSKMMRLNGIELCPVSEVDVENAFFDVEVLYIPTTIGVCYDVILNLPYEGPAKISMIKQTTFVYYAAG